VGFKENHVFRHAGIVKQGLHVRQMLRRRGHQARRQRAKPLPDQLFFDVGKGGFIQTFGEQQQPFAVPGGQFRAVNLILRATRQAQPLIAQAVKAATPDAGNVQPALFVEAKQRGAHEALAKPHAFQQGGQAAEPNLTAAMGKRVTV
jgi:hypothetical protein